MQTNEPISSPEQTNTPPVTETPASQKPAVDKPIFIWLLVVLIVILLGTSCVFVYKYYDLRQQVAKQQSAPPVVPTKDVVASPTSSLPSQPTSDPAVNWKTYNNDLYSFTVNYPPDFYLKEWKQQDGTFSLSISDMKDYGGPMSLKSGKIAVSIFVGRPDFERKDFYYGGYQWTKSILEDLADATVGSEKEHKYEINTKQSNINETNYTGVIYKSVPSGEVATSGGPSLNAALIKNNMTILISAMVGGDSNLVFSEPYSGIFDQVVSSFKFTE